MNKHLLLKVLTPAAAVASIVLPASTPVSAEGNGGQNKPKVCHPVDGNGNTGEGWSLIPPAEASKHIDEATGAGFHTSHDGRTDVYAVNGQCPNVTQPTNPPTTTAPPTTVPPTDPPTTTQPSTTTTVAPTTTVPATTTTVSVTTVPPSTPTTEPTTTVAPVPQGNPDSLCIDGQWVIGAIGGDLMILLSLDGAAMGIREGIYTDIPDEFDVLWIGSDMERLERPDCTPDDSEETPRLPATQ